MSHRIVLITGANGDLGQAIAHAVLDDLSTGFVWLGIHRHREQADKLVQAHAGRAACVELDVTHADAWFQAIRTIVGQHKRIEVLVNNAGGHEDALLGTMSADAWERVLELNLHSVFHGCQAVLPAMISQRFGRIVNVGSLSALLAPPGQTNYAAAKAGVVALTQSLAKEVARIGITVNAVCPGYLETKSLRQASEEERQATLAKVPMRRFGRPEEVAAAVRFLACDDAGYITGSVLKIDGGIL